MQFFLQQFADAAHRAQAGAQHESPSARGAYRQPGSLGDGFLVERAVRVGHVLRGIQQRVFCVVKRAAPDHGFGVRQPQRMAIMRKVVAHGERGGNENPRARMAFHLALENRRDVQRRQVQRQCLRIHLQPLHHALPAFAGHAAAPALQTLHQLLCPLQALRQALATRGLGFQLLAHFLQFFRQSLQGRHEIFFILHPRRRQAQVFAFHRQTQVARRLVQRQRRILQGQVILRRGNAFMAHITRQVDQLRGGHALAEEQPGHFRQLVRLVENHCVAGRQQLAHAFVLEHHISEEQVMVHHHHVGHLRILPRGQDKTFLDVGTLLPEAVFARRRGCIPGGGIFRHVAALGLVTGFAVFGKACDLVQVRHRFARSQAPCIQRAFQVIRAHIVGAPLEQRNRRAHLQGGAHGRQVTIEQLILQGFGAGGNNHLAARQQCRREIGKGLAGAGARLGHQRAVGLYRRRNVLRHFQLLRARTIAGNGRGKRPGRGKDGGKIRHGARGMVARLNHQPWRKTI